MVDWSVGGVVSFPQYGCDINYKGKLKGTIYGHDCIEVAAKIIRALNTIVTLS